MNKDSHLFLKHSLNYLDDLIIWIGNDGRMLKGNQSALNFYGYDLDTFVSLSIHDLDTHFQRSAWSQHWGMLKRKKVLSVTVEHQNSLGQYVPVEIVDSYQCFDGEEYSVAVVRPISHRSEHSQRMQLMEFSVDQMVDSALWIDKNAKIIYANDATCLNLGYAHDELTNMAIYDIDPHFPKDAWPAHWKDLQEHKSLTFETEQRHKEGHLVPVEVNANLVKSNEQEFNCAFIRDITDRKYQRAELLYLATHDSLTGLPNRNLLNERVGQSIGMAMRNQSHVGVLLIDLDKFKMVNDNFGHAAGDVMLKTVSQRMQGVLRSCDTVSRLGGDEFVVVLDNIDNPDHCVQVCTKLSEVLGLAISFGEHELEPAASIGVAIWPKDGKDVDTLLKNADIAMYHAKAMGRGRFMFFEDEMSQRVIEQMEIVTGLNRALSHDELLLHFQPVFDLKTEQLLGAEALLRWQDPVHGLIPPNRFISVAEESGLIVPIGEWVIREACKQNMIWLKKGMPVVPIAVNISARQLYDNDIIKTVTGALGESGLPSGMLRIELTESMLMDDPQQVISILNAFREMGLGISIDDFGTGYSSLSYLQKFPVDIIKIDRSFLKDIGTSDDEPVIANAIVSLAHSMGYKVVAEGIETAAQRDHMLGQGCDMVQGFMFGRPVPANIFEDFFESCN